jgi:PAS domain-containing protein
MTTLYLDMDGVVADFNSYAEKILGKSQQDEVWSEEEWSVLKQYQRIYRDLPKTAYADQLVELCKKKCEQQNWQFLFLTAVPKGNDIRWAFWDKVLWAQRYFPDTPVHFGPYSKNKYVHCESGDILIDDRTSNIQEWTEAGGRAILHRQFDFTINELEKLS